METTKNILLFLALGLLGWQLYKKPISPRVIIPKMPDGTVPPIPSSEVIPEMSILPGMPEQDFLSLLKYTPSPTAPYQTPVEFYEDPNFYYQLLKDKEALGVVQTGLETGWDCLSGLFSSAPEEETWVTMQAPGYDYSLGI